ncbi:putative leucine-rich repeat-containing protein DDB_G0290503 [Mytilus edulis]|uniref:putative leucine-rich repeat-containing protein DDB_G0290503 n=1 Tax=Mytilus edulis TaxID=6550 RepID=UPI0039EF3440
MASSKPIQCGPCQEGKVKTKADIWCNNCDEGLCSTCSGHHKRSKLSRHHKTIDINIHKPSIHAIKTVCDKHYQQLNLYCTGHLMPCCDGCISTSHSKCTGIKSLADVVEKTKIEKLKESLDTDIRSTLDILNKMVKNKSGNIKREEQQYESIKETIAIFREKINNHLDHLEDKLCHEIDTILNQEKSKMSNLTTEIEEKKGKLNNIKDQLNAVTTKSSKLHSFLEVHQIEQQVHQCQRFVVDLEDDGRAKQLEIKLKQNEEIDEILCKLESLESLGEVIVDKIEIAEENRGTSVRRGAQVESGEQSNINDMNMNIETKIVINMKNTIRDMICLMDGRFIISLYTGKVNLLNPDGKLEKQFTISGTKSVTQINQDTIAITYPNERTIKMFNMEKETITKVIKLDKPCYGLSFSNNSFAVGLDKNEILIIDLAGNTLKSIPVQSESTLEFLVHRNDRVIYSDYEDATVYCVDESGTHIWKNKKDLSFPAGLCTDSYGNIFVADYTSNRIIVISKDGKDSKELINEKDGPKNPRCICFKHNESSGFISDGLGTYLTKFNLSCR